MTSKDLKATAKHYHSQGQIAASFVSGLWLDWGLQEGWSRSSQGAEHNRRWKPNWSSIASIVRTTNRPRFLFNSIKQKHNTNYRGTADLGLHKYQDSFGPAPCYQRQKPTDCTHNTRQVTYYFRKNTVPRFKRTS